MKPRSSAFDAILCRPARHPKHTLTHHLAPRAMLCDVLRPAHEDVTMNVRGAIFVT